MNLKTGIDIVKVGRMRTSIQKGGKRFLDRVFTDAEINECSRKKTKYLSFAARFAAKEAFVKALGKVSRGLSYKDVEIKTSSEGVPSVRISSKIKKQYRLTGSRISVSLAHENEFAIAIIVIT